VYIAVFVASTFDEWARLEGISVDAAKNGNGFLGAEKAARFLRFCEIRWERGRNSAFLPVKSLDLRRVLADGMGMRLRRCAVQRFITGRF
jgi:hypothetical protein